MAVEPETESRRGVLARCMHRLLSKCARVLARLPTPMVNRSLQLALDGLLSAIALLLAYELRFDGDIPMPHRVMMWALMLLLPAIRPLLMWGLGGYDAIWRFFNLRDASVLAFSAAPPTVLMLFVRYFIGQRFRHAVIPASVIVIEYGVYLALASSLRIFRRVTYEASRPGESRRYRALLVGTEATLPSALRHLEGSPEIEVMGLLAPEPNLAGLRIGGYMVLEKPEALARLLVTRRIELVLIADARPEWISDTVSTASEFGAEVRLLPSAANVVRGDVRISAKASPEAVLSRLTGESEEPGSGLSQMHPQVVEKFRDRVVLITGAGGSIGSELARQVAALPVSGVVLLDRDENSIFELSNNLAVQALISENPPRLAALVGDIRDADHLRLIFEQYRPHIVLHAAAYKHVPLMESNACEAVLNNVTGTSVVARAAQAFGTERFVLISTDKAVRPSSVMGATKRMAEMLVSELARMHQAQRTGASTFTNLSCVRFGNVVGSRGSVVPIFLRQIADGGPITITDEHMTRYFMTIPEAAQLVLQAASLAANGDIYMLDMGDPIKITALARKLIELSGLQPEKDIEICFVGARPGEKIVEQLWHHDAQVSETEFPRVFAVKANVVAAEFQKALSLLEHAATQRNESAVIESLRSMPIGFKQTLSASRAGDELKPEGNSSLIH